MYHFRFATHWSVSLKNVHPFVLSESPRDIVKTEWRARAVVGHNGVITWLWIEHHSDFSDTMVFVRDVLSKKSVRENIMEDEMQLLLGKFVTWSKVAILDWTGRFKWINKDDGIVEKDGIWYSNSWYKSFNWYYPLSSIYQWGIDDEYFPRKQYTPVNTHQICDYCQTAPKNRKLKKDYAWDNICEECWYDYYEKDIPNRY